MKTAERVRIENNLERSIDRLERLIKLDAPQVIIDAEIKLIKKRFELMRDSLGIGFSLN